MKERGSSQYSQELKKQEKIYRLFTSPPPIFGALIFPTFIFATSRQATWHENAEVLALSSRPVSQVESSFSSLVRRKRHGKHAEKGYCLRHNLIVSASVVLPSILALREQPVLAKLAKLPEQLPGEYRAGGFALQSPSRWQH